VFKVLHSMW